LRQTTNRVEAHLRRSRLQDDRRVPRPCRQDRGCAPRTRNARLATIRSFYRYAALNHPEHAATIERVLAIPLKRHDRTLVTWLTGPELDALLAAPDRRTWTGLRDHTMILLAAHNLPSGRGAEVWNSIPAVTVDRRPPPPLRCVSC
jgi:site-specific recombinase XerD